MKVVKEIPLRVSVILILSALVTLLCGLVFVSLQQAYRLSANDPQIQISEDMVAYLAGGGEVQSVMPPSEVDIAKSLVWFLSVYNEKGEILESNAKLDGQVPVLPQGVLDHAKQNGQNRVTWEPKDGVRIAAVVTSYEGGYVLAGRSLRETDNRVMMLGEVVGWVWVLGLGLIFAGVWFLIPKKLH